MLPEQTSAGRASGGTGGWKANLNRKVNGLALEGTFLWDFTYLCWNLTGANCEHSLYHRYLIATKIGSYFAAVDASARVYSQE
jgi:hypothetical protein